MELWCLAVLLNLLIKTDLQQIGLCPAWKHNSPNLTVVLDDCLFSVVSCICLKNGHCHDYGIVFVLTIEWYLS
jgi:hypothetical protein